jgi:hypothetical protein
MAIEPTIQEVAIETNLKQFLLVLCVSLGVATLPQIVSWFRRIPYTLLLVIVGLGLVSLDVQLVTFHPNSFSISSDLQAERSPLWRAVYYFRCDFECRSWLTIKSHFKSHFRSLLPGSERSLPTNGLARIRAGDCAGDCANPSGEYPGSKPDGKRQYVYSSVAAASDVWSITFW